MVTKSQQFLKDRKEKQFEEKWGTLYALVLCILGGILLAYLYK